VVKGKYINKLEENFKEMYEVKHAIACASCTAGLTIALDAGGFSNKLVALPAFTWPSTYYAVSNNYNYPLFCDIDEKTWLTKPRLEGFNGRSMQREKTDLIVAVDTFGNRCPKLETDIPVIYDAAHGFGLVGLGNRGLAEVVSFSFTKTVTGMQGGMILTNDDELAMKSRKLVNLYAKLTELNAYVCLKSMENYVQNLRNRKDIVDMYCDLLKCKYEIQDAPDYHNLSVFSILLWDNKKRDRVAGQFIKNGIEVKIYYKPLVDSLPKTNRVYDKIISLPTWRGVEEHVPEICEIINNA
jgi:dTDP-4-amino-4,6-dideoxygalactose transaminase